MATQPSYGVMNMTLDNTKTDCYVLKQSGSPKSIEIPPSAPEYGFITPEEITRFICTDSLDSLPAAKKQEIINSISVTGE